LIAWAYAILGEVDCFRTTLGPLKRGKSQKIRLPKKDLTHRDTVLHWWQVCE